jgi:hypothetical protein
VPPQLPSLLTVWVAAGIAAEVLDAALVDVDERVAVVKVDVTALVLVVVLDAALVDVEVLDAALVDVEVLDAALVDVEVLDAALVDVEERVAVEVTAVLVLVVDGTARLELELVTDEELDTTLDEEESREDDGATVEDWLSVAEDATEEDTLTEDPQRPNSGLQPVPQ